MIVIGWCTDTRASADVLFYTSTRRDQVVHMMRNILVSDLSDKLYSLSDTARIISVNSSTLRSWVKAYTHESNGMAHRYEPVIAGSPGDNRATLTFLEMVELMFVKLFRSKGVTMQIVRRAAKRAAEQFQSPYPFATKRFDTDGARVFATLHTELGDLSTVEDLERGQYAFDSVVRPFFHKLDYQDDNNALRYWPLDHSGRIVLDPQRFFGKPIDEETGVPTFALYHAVRAGNGQDIDEVADWFEVPSAAVNAAITYEEQLRAKPMSFRG